MEFFQLCLERNKLENLVCLFYNLFFAEKIIVSPIFCSALFDIYLGSDSIDYNAKVQVSENFYKILNGTNKDEKIEEQESLFIQETEKKSRLPKRLAKLKSKL